MCVYMWWMKEKGKRGGLLFKRGRERERENIKGVKKKRKKR